MQYSGEKKALAAAYLPEILRSQYCRRYIVSRPCSGWERVVPLRRWPPEQFCFDAVFNSRSDGAEPFTTKESTERFALTFTAVAANYLSKVGTKEEGLDH